VISSSPKVISWLAAVFCVGVSAAGTSIAADAPLASDNDNPAAPNNGTAHARPRFGTCFARDMVESSHTLLGQMLGQSIV
jgi:hypothetical protein